jgi:hypothetical protein
MVVRESVKVEVHRLFHGYWVCFVGKYGSSDIADNIIPHKGLVVVSTDEFKCFFASKVSGGGSVMVKLEDSELERVVVKYICADSVEQPAFNLDAFGE